MGASIDCLFLHFLVVWSAELRTVVGRDVLVEPRHVLPQALLPLLLLSTGLVVPLRVCSIMNEARE